MKRAIFTVALFCCISNQYFCAISLGGGENPHRRYSPRALSGFQSRQGRAGVIPAPTVKVRMKKDAAVLRPSVILRRDIFISYYADKAARR